MTWLKLLTHLFLPFKCLFQEIWVYAKIKFNLYPVGIFSLDTNNTNVSLFMTVQLDFTHTRIQPVHLTICKPVFQPALSEPPNSITRKVVGEWADIRYAHYRNPIAKYGAPLVPGFYLTSNSGRVKQKRDLFKVQQLNQRCKLHKCFDWGLERIWTIFDQRQCRINRFWYR